MHILKDVVDLLWFLWRAVVAYAQTPEGQAELLQLEKDFNIPVPSANSPNTGEMMTPEGQPTKESIRGGK